ncbi:hypothetical protein GCM10009123_22340 [Kangiella japonica]|uniref:Uncharacterized protein n=1 Tax=Kangiella japonica TaxID=647384 RepID=A0ABN0T7Q3_9GAMM
MYSSINRSLFWFVTITVLLAIPLVAMQFTQEVNWGVADFIVAAVLLISGALIYEAFIRRYSRSSTSKLKPLLFSIGLIALILMIWAELAVGVFGTPFAGT